MRLSTTQRVSIFALVSFLLLLFTPSAFAQCGDFDNSGTNTITDIVDLNAYLFVGGAAPQDYDYADFDLHQKLTFNDLAHLYACAFICDFYDVQCPPTEAAIDPEVDPAFVIKYPEAVPIGHTSYAITLEADAPFKSQAICLPLRLRIDGAVPQIDSIVTPSSSSYSDASGSVPLRYNALIHPDSGIVIVSGTKGNSIPSFLLYDQIATIFVTVPIRPYKQQIDLQFVELTPEEAAPGQENSIFAMYLGPGFLNTGELPKEPVLESDCCILPGDVNGDGHTTITDAVTIICFIFGGCSTAGVCPQTVDIDGSGSINIADAVALINYIFAGGPPPVCGP